MSGATKCTEGTADEWPLGAGGRAPGLQVPRLEWVTVKLRNQTLVPAVQACECARNQRTVHLQRASFRHVDHVSLKPLPEEEICLQEQG